MKGSGILILFVLCYSTAFAQVDLGDIASLMDQPKKKIEHYLHKKGFTRESYPYASEVVFTSQYVEDSVVISRSFQFVFKEDAMQMLYKTTSFKELQNWKKELHETATPFNRNETGLFYNAKEHLTLKCSEEMQDTVQSYTLSATKKVLPKIKDLAFAEDLLQIDAHIYLEALFGKHNVKEETFYFSETLQKKCSIIYPNTPRQAIFLWNDEASLKDIAFIIIGEYENKSSQNVQSPLTLAQWKSRQGIICGMNLRELELVNQNEVSFYKWRTSMSGTLSTNKGLIDFTRIEIVLDCLNCNFVSAQGDGMVISSIEANEQKQKWYVRSFAVVPPKK
jgi:hypothetical protein